MRAAVLGSDGAMALADVDDPTPGPRDLILRVTGCGVCGSDVKSRGFMPAGTVMGHELAGAVVDAGAEVRPAWTDGEHAAVLPVFACMHCDLCRAGEVAHCADAGLVGLGGGGGGFAELIRVSADLAFRLPPSVPPTFGPLVEPYAVGLHVARAAEIELGDSVLFIGAGSVGLTTATWARALGAGRIVVSDPVASRREKVAALGLGETIDPTVDALGGPYDVVVDCVGHPGLLDAACGAAATHGRVVVAGVCAETDSLTHVVPLLKELTIRFAVYYRPAEFQAVVDAFADGRIDPSGLLTRSAPLSELDGILAHPHPDDVKIVIDPTL